MPNVPAWIAPLQFGLHIEFVLGLLVVAGRLLNLGFHLDHVDFRRDELGIDFGDLPFGRFKSRLLLRAVQLEQYSSFPDRLAVTNVHLSNSPGDFRHNRHGPEEQRC